MVELATEAARTHAFAEKTLQPQVRGWTSDRLERLPWCTTHSRQAQQRLALHQTRLPTATLFGNLAVRATVEEFLDWFKGVEEWQVGAVLHQVADNTDAKVTNEDLV